MLLWKRNDTVLGLYRTRDGEASIEYGVRSGGDTPDTMVKAVQSASDDRYRLCDRISYCIDANYFKGTTFESFLNKKRRQLVIEDYG